MSDNRSLARKTLTRKNWALFAVLLAIAVILFTVTIIRFGGH